MAIVVPRGSHGGYSELVVRRGPEFADRVREAVPGGADGLIDAGLLDELAVPAVRDGGRIATVRAFREDTRRGITFHPVTVRSYAREHAKLDRLRRQAGGQAEAVHGRGKGNNPGRIVYSRGL